MGELGELELTLTADIGDLKKNLDQANRETRKFQQETEKQTKPVRKNLLLVAGGFAGIGIAAGATLGVVASRSGLLTAQLSDLADGMGFVIDTAILAVGAGGIMPAFTQALIDAGTGISTSGILEGLAAFDKTMQNLFGTIPTLDPLTAGFDGLVAQGITGIGNLKTTITDLTWPPWPVFPNLPVLPTFGSIGLPTFPTSAEVQTASDTAGGLNTISSIMGDMTTAPGRINMKSVMDSIKDVGSQAVTTKNAVVRLLTSRVQKGIDAGFKTWIAPIISILGVDDTADAITTVQGNMTVSNILGANISPSGNWLDIPIKADDDTADGIGDVQNSLTLSNILGEGKTAFDIPVTVNQGQNLPLPVFAGIDDTVATFELNQAVSAFKRNITEDHHVNLPVFGQVQDASITVSVNDEASTILDTITNKFLALPQDGVIIPVGITDFPEGFKSEEGLGVSSIGPVIDLTTENVRGGALGGGGGDTFNTFNNTFTISGEVSGGLDLEALADQIAAILGARVARGG